MNPQQEQGREMTARHALALYSSSSAWLQSALSNHHKCSCGSCHLCAYRFLESLATGQQIMEWDIRNIRDLARSNETEIRPGEWVPARPMNYKHDTVLGRLKTAWHVLTGKADAVYWPEQ